KADAAISLGIFRLNGLAPASVALYCFLFARYGIRGMVDLRKFWRPLLLILAGAGCMLSGFRSALLMFLLTFAVLFLCEGLHRTRLLPASIAAGMIAAALFLPMTDKLPLVAQRTLSFLSFLPIKLDPLAAQTAFASSNWRIDMWKAA